MNFKQVKGVKERDPCTIVSWASAHSQVSTYVTVLAVQMESAHSQASAQVMWAIDDEAGENTYEDDSDIDVYLDPFSDSEEYNFTQLSGSTVHRTVLSLYFA